MSEIQGINIKEVWNYRLSTASVYIDRRAGAWVCYIISKNNPDFVEGAEPTPPLETHDTGIAVVKGDMYDTEKLKVCFEWFKSRRDAYALDNIDDLKPSVALIEVKQALIAEAVAGLSVAEANEIMSSVLGKLQSDQTLAGEV